MSRIILILTVAIVLFVGAAGLSWYLQPPPADPDAGNGKEGEGKVAKTASKKEAASKSGTGGPKLVDGLKNNPDSSQMAQLTANMLVREETLKSREEHLVTREKHLNAIYENTKHEHAKLDIVRREIQTELNSLKKLMDEIELRTAAELSLKKANLAKVEDIDRMTNQVKQSEFKNMQKFSPIIDKMEPEPAAALISEMLNGGRADEASYLLSVMKPSASSAVLGELSKTDSAVAAKLITRMLQIKVGNDQK